MATSLIAPPRSRSLVAGVSACLLTVLIVSLVASHSLSPPSRFVASPVAAGAPSTPSPPAASRLDLDAAARAARSAFRREGDAWSGGGDSYGVRATASGLEVTPVRRASAGAPRAATPLRLEITRIARGDRPLGVAAAAARARVEPDGHLAFDRGEVVQHLRNRPEGTELSFSFERPPSGRGDVVVHLGVSGQEHVSATATGHHFADRGAGLGARVGRATWVDARGQKTDVPVRLAEGGLEIAVAARVVDAAAYPAVLDPVVSPEIEVDAPIPGVVVGYQPLEGLACDGGVCLVVWGDTRTNVTRRYATRMTPDGTVLDPEGIYLGDGARRGGRVAVAAGGGQFLVAFVEPGGEGFGAPLRCVRIGVDGAVLDPGGFAIGTRVLDTNSERGLLRATFAGGNFLVAWTEWIGSNTQTNNLRLARISPAGGVLDPGGAVLLSDAWLMDLEGGGDSAYLLWIKDDALCGSPLDPAVGLADPAGVVFAAQRSPDGDSLSGAVAFDGERYNVVWSSMADGEALLMRLSPDGAFLDASPRRVTERTTRSVGDAAIFGATLSLLGSSPSGEEGGTSLFLSRWREGPLTPDQDFPGYLALSSGALAVSSAGVMAVWNEPYDGSDGRVLSALVRPEGEPFASGPSPCVWRSAHSERHPAVAWDGSNYLVVWETSREGAPDDMQPGIYGARVSPAGEILDIRVLATPEPYEPNISLLVGDPVRPHVLFDGANFLVWWERCADDGCYGPADAVRVSPAGIVLDVPSIQLPTPWFGPSLSDAFPAFDGGAYFRYPLASDDSAPWLQRMHPDGTFSEPWLLEGVTTLSGWGFPGPVVRGDDGYLLLLGHDHFNQQFSWSGVLMNRDAEVVSPGRFTIPSINYLGAAGFAEGVYVLLWDKPDNGDEEVRVTRVTAAGEVLDPEGIVVARFPARSGYLLPTNMSVAPAPGGVLLTWLARNGSRSRATVEGARFDASGTVGPRFMIADATNDDFDSQSFALAASGEGRALVAVQRFIDGPSYGASRVRVRVIGDECDEIVCPGGDCVDGVCCDSPCGGGDPNDCMACSVARGAAVDGVCAPLDGTACDDGDACTLGDRCAAGACVAGPDAACTTTASGIGGGSAASGGGGAQGASETPGPIAIGGCGCRAAGGETAQGGSSALPCLGLLATGLWVTRARRRPSGRARWSRVFTSG